MPGNFDITCLPYTYLADCSHSRYYFPVQAFATLYACRGGGRCCPYYAAMPGWRDGRNIPVPPYLSVGLVVWAGGLQWEGIGAVTGGATNRRNKPWTRRGGVTASLK